MDAMDIAILQGLKQNGRASVSVISKQVNLSIPAVAERIRKLESAGIIHRYTVVVNREMTGEALTAFILVSLEGTQHAQPFRNRIIAQRQVLECHHLTGAYDYLLKVVAVDMQALEMFISQTLKAMPGVTGSNTMLSLQTLKEEINT